MDRNHLEDKIAEARDLVLLLMDGDKSALSGACLYHALAVQRILGGQIVAGSYSWRFTTTDTGENATHFSCMFDRVSQKQALNMIRQEQPLDVGILPEMHIWNELNGKVLDISTLHLPDFAMRTGGFSFEKCLTPPAYHYGPLADEAKGNYLYQPHLFAVWLARRAARHIEQKVRL